MLNYFEVLEFKATLFVDKLTEVCVRSVCRALKYDKISREIIRDL